MRVRLQHQRREELLREDAVMLDDARITIGDHVRLGSRVGIYTANHAIDPEERIAGACYATPATLGDAVRVGGGVTIGAGVAIGDGAIIAAGRSSPGTSPPARSRPASCVRSPPDDTTGWRP